MPNPDRDRLFDFDTKDWLGFSFGENGDVEIVIFDEEEHVAASFSADRAVLLGLSLIEMAREIRSVQGAENGQPVGLAEVMAKYEVSHTSELFAILRPKATNG